MSYAKADPRVTDRQKLLSQASEVRSTLDVRLLRFLEALCAGRFFGRVAMSFQNGKVVDVRTEQTRKLEEL